MNNTFYGTDSETWYVNCNGVAWLVQSPDMVGRRPEPVPAVPPDARPLRCDAWGGPGAAIVEGVSLNVLGALSEYDVDVAMVGRPVPHGFRLEEFCTYLQAEVPWLLITAVETAEPASAPDADISEAQLRRALDAYVKEVGNMSTFVLRNDDSLASWTHRANAMKAAALRALTQPAVTVDEYDEDGEYVGSVVVTARYVFDDTAPRTMARKGGG